MTWGGLAWWSSGKDSGPMQGAQVQSLVGEPSSHLPQLRVRMPHLKIPHAATKTWSS